MKQIRLFSVVFAFTAFLSVHAADNNFDINLRKTGAPIQSTMYGIFFEDINFAADGGLSANLIRNNSFEQKLAWAPDYDCRMTGSMPSCSRTAPSSSPMPCRAGRHSAE